MHYNILECRLLFLIISERVIFLFDYPSVQHHLRIFPRVERWQRSEDFHTVTRKSVLFLHHHSHHLKQRQSLLLCHFVGSDIKTYSLLYHQLWSNSLMMEFWNGITDEQKIIYVICK